MQIEFININRTRSAFSSPFNAAFKLPEKSHAAAQLQIGVQHISLQKITVMRSLRAPRRIIVILRFLAHFAAEREKILFPFCRRIVVSAFAQRNTLIERRNCYGSPRGRNTRCLRPRSISARAGVVNVGRKPTFRTPPATTLVTPKASTRRL